MGSKSGEFFHGFWKWEVNMVIPNIIPWLSLSFENDHIHGWFFPHFQTNPDEVSLVPIAAHHYLLPKFAPRYATSQIPFAQRGCTWTHRLCFHWYIWFGNICSMLAIVLVGGWLYHCPPNVVSIQCHSHQPQVTTSHNPNSPVLNGKHPIA